MQHQAVDSEPADGADQTFLPIIEFLFPYVIYGNCKIYLVNKNFSILWRHFVRRLKCDPVMIFCSTLILPEISRPLMTTTLPCAGMSPASFNALEHGFISHVHLNRGSAERRIEYINILQRNCIEYVIRGLHLSSAPIISIQQFQLLVYCAVQNLATQRSSHNKSEELNDMAEALIQFSLDLATEDLGQHSDIFDISAAFSRFSVGVSLVKCAFGYLERYFRVYRNERYIHYDELMPNLFKNVLQDRGVDLVALDDVSFIVLASYTMETAKDRRLLGVSKLVDIFRIELLKCHDIISRLNREELESDLVCMNHFEGNFVFFHTDHSNETSVVQSSHPLIDRSSSLSHLVRDLQSFQMALSTTVSRVEHKWSHSYDLFVPPCCRSDRILQLAISFAEHHTTHPYSVIPKPLPSSNMREVVSVYDADLVLSLPREELFELILLGNFLGYMELLDLTCATVASLIKNKTPEEIRATFNIGNDFTEEEEAQVREENKWLEDA